MANWGGVGRTGGWGSTWARPPDSATAAAPSGFPSARMNRMNPRRFHFCARLYPSGILAEISLTRFILEWKVSRKQLQGRVTITPSDFSEDGCYRVFLARFFVIFRVKGVIAGH